MYTKEQLENHGAINTFQEIQQQPETWLKLLNKEYVEQRKNTKVFLRELISQFDHLKIIFTGAGTSAFIGDMLVAEIQSQVPKHVQISSVPTTDIVSNPEKYLKEELPTILVSFGRSGNSPESLAAANLGEQFIHHFYHIVVTNNEDGELAKRYSNTANTRTLLLPAETHDKGFAMTSSFSSMALTAFLLFQENENQTISNVVQNGQEVLSKAEQFIHNMTEIDIKRLVYLGSGTLKEAAHEASLKMLELTGGKIATFYESSLGFRHGPKSIIDESTLVVIFVSQDAYTRQYDLDMVKELADSDKNTKVIALTEGIDEEVPNYADLHFTVNKEVSMKSDFLLALNYMMIAQLYAVEKSISYRISPDNPSPGGNVNRVVQGVKIYEY